MQVAVGVIVVLVFFLLIAVGAAVRVLREYERGVIFRLGRLIAQKGPGLIFLIPFIDRMVRVDLRTVTLNIPPQEVITRDNVPASVNAVCYFRVVNANDAVVQVENFLMATSLIAQTTLRAVLGRAELDTLLSERERRAKIIAAEGEFQAADKLSQAAEVIGRHPAAIQLRYLQTLLEIGSEHNSTTIFPLPIDLIRPFLESQARGAADAPGSE